MDKSTTLLDRICLGLMVIAGATLCFMLVFTVVNVVMRAFGHPIIGDFEVISFLGAVVVGLSLPYTSMIKGHVAVDFLPEKLPKYHSLILQAATRIVGVALFGWIGFYFMIMGCDLIKSGEVTPIFRLPYYPIAFGLTFSCLIQSLVLLTDVEKILRGIHE